MSFPLHTRQQFGDTSYTKPDYQQVSEEFTHTNGHTNGSTNGSTNHSQNVSRQSRKFRGLSQKFHGLTEKSYGLSSMFHGRALLPGVTFGATIGATWLLETALDFQVVKCQV